MYRGRRQAGYTIIETLIFMAVSGAMFISIMGVIGGRQGRVEFQQNARDFEIIMQDIANDVSTGYYPYVGQTATSAVECRNTAGVLSFHQTANFNVGTSRGCIFIGRTLQFRPDGEANRYSLLTVAGKRETAAKRSPQNVSESGSKVFGFGITPAAPFTDFVETKQVRYQFGCAMFTQNPAATLATLPCNSSADFVKTDHITFLTTFAQNAVGGGVEAGTYQVDLLVRPVALSGGRPNATLATELESLGNAAVVSNPAGGVVVCLESETSDQHAVLKFGGVSSGFSTNMVINSGKCS